MHPKQCAAWVAAITRSDSVSTSVAFLVERLVSEGACRAAGAWYRPANGADWSELAVHDPAGELSRPEATAQGVCPTVRPADRIRVELPLADGTLFLEGAGWSEASGWDEDAAEALLLVAGLVDAAAGRLSASGPPAPLPRAAVGPAIEAATLAYVDRLLEPLDEGDRRAVLASLRPPRGS